MKIFEKRLNTQVIKKDGTEGYGYDYYFLGIKIYTKVLYIYM